MKIYANGCSFTHGDELVNPTHTAWPYLLADKLGGIITNDAVGGGTNSRTMYHTIKHIQQDYDLYLIAWTTYARFTFYNSDSNVETNFYPAKKNIIFPSNEKFYIEWGNTLYKHWYNELYAFKLWLQQIIQLQSVLRNNNYLMINTMNNNINRWTANKEVFIESVKRLINFDIMNDEQIFDEYNEIQYYISIIDFSKFYQWDRFYITQLCSQFKCGPGGHILEDGHAHLAELIYKHV